MAATSTPAQAEALLSHGFKNPGYTGYIPGLQDVFKKTPVMAQLEVACPDADSFLKTRQDKTPKGPPAKDPPTLKHGEQDNLWPSLQETAAQPSLKPPPNTLAFGDLRIDVFKTCNNSDFKAPFPGNERLRSPNRNEDLAMTTASLVDIYTSAYNRVGEDRLQKIIATMRLRLMAKMGNANNNAFKFRKLFQMYDTEKTGQVHYEDFRNMAETFGMQLDDDSLLALFKVYDPEGTGYLAYHDLAKHLMDEDCYSLYVNVDVSAERAKEDAMMAQVATMQKLFAPRANELLAVLKAFDTQGSGLLSQADLVAGCAGLGLLLTDRELHSMAQCAVTADAADEGALFNEAGQIAYMNFIKMLTAGPAAVKLRTRRALDSSWEFGKSPRSKPGSKLASPAHTTHTVASPGATRK